MSSPCGYCARASRLKGAHPDFQTQGPFVPSSGIEPDRRASEARVAIHARWRCAFGGNRTRSAGLGILRSVLGQTRGAPGRTRTARIVGLQPPRSACCPVRSSGPRNRTLLSAFKARRRSHWTQPRSWSPHLELHQALSLTKRACRSTGNRTGIDLVSRRTR